MKTAPKTTAKLAAIFFIFASMTAAPADNNTRQGMLTIAAEVAKDCTLDIPPQTPMKYPKPAGDIHEAIVTVNCTIGTSYGINLQPEGGDGSWRMQNTDTACNNNNICGLNYHIQRGEYDVEPTSKIHANSGPGFSSVSGTGDVQTIKFPISIDTEQEIAGGRYEQNVIVIVTIN